MFKIEFHENLNEKTTKHVFQSFRISIVDCKASEKKLEEQDFEVQIAPKRLMLVKVEILKIAQQVRKMKLKDNLNLCLALILFDFKLFLKTLTFLNASNMWFMVYL